MTAMSLFVQFYNVSDRAVHFYNSDNCNKQPHWWKRKVWPQWKDTRVAGTAYSRVLKDSNISWGKVIHMRSAGIEFASSHGELDGGSVSTMSKHQTSKLEKAYLTELHPQVMRVMSGHKKDDKYYVPRALLTLPWSDDQICQHIFPKLALWQSQFRNPLGDHSKAAENMLFGLLPYLAKVVVQDRIYWVNLYPDHEVTRLLLNTMPPEYERWAAKARGDIEQLVLAKQDVLVSDLNDAAKAALMKVLDCLDQRFDWQMVELNALDDVNRQLRHLVGTLIQIMRSRDGPSLIRTLEMPVADDHLERQALVVRNQATEETETAQETEITHFATQMNNETRAALVGGTTNSSAEGARRENLADGRAFLTHQLRPPPQRTVTQALRNKVRTPIFPARIPPTVLEMCNQYKLGGLKEWETAKMTSWPQKLKMAYGRRKYLNYKVTERAMRLQVRTIDQRMIRAAEAMDNERTHLGMSTAMFVTHLKKLDPVVKKNKRDDVL